MTDLRITWTGHPALERVRDWFGLNDIDAGIVKSNQTAQIDVQAMTVTFDAFVTSIDGGRAIGPIGPLIERVTRPIAFLPSHVGLKAA